MEIPHGDAAIHVQPPPESGMHSIIGLPGKQQKEQHHQGGKCPKSSESSLKMFWDRRMAKAKQFRKYF